MALKSGGDELSYLCHGMVRTGLARNGVFIRAQCQNVFTNSTS
jgi:hypothetical protein